MRRRHCYAARALAVLVVVVAIADSPAAAAPRDRNKGSGGGSSALRSIECAVCHAMAVEVRHELAKTANSTEIIELSRRPSSDLGRQQYQKGGRAIKYVDSEMRITDALQAACQVLKRSYRVQTVDSKRRLAQVRRIDDRPPTDDLEGVDWASGGDKIHSMCEELADERERTFINAIRDAQDLSASVCFGVGDKSKAPSKASCGNAHRGKCLPGEISLADDDTGVEPCWACERGKFQDLSGQTSCVACPSNFSTPERGSTSKQNCHAMCPQGSSGIGGVEPCQPCPLHTYQDSDGGSECAQCPNGLGTATTGASSKHDCIGICGDGRVATSEGCDDGNSQDGDGCSSSCAVEPGWKCQAKKGTKASGRRVQTCERLPASVDKALHAHTEPAAATDESSGRAQDGKGAERMEARRGGWSGRRRRPRPPPLEPATTSPHRTMGARVASLGAGAYVRVPRFDELLSTENQLAPHFVQVCV